MQAVILLFHDLKCPPPDSVSQDVIRCIEKIDVTDLSELSIPLLKRKENKK